MIQKRQSSELITHDFFVVSFSRDMFLVFLLSSRTWDVFLDKDNYFLDSAMVAACLRNFDFDKNFPNFPGVWPTVFGRPVLRARYRVRRARIPIARGVIRK